MTRNGSERCTACAAPAVVRIKGVAHCARCGLERSFSPDGKLRRTRRALVFGIFSSGLLAKMAMGTIAVAAIGGAALAMPASLPEATPGVPAATSQFAGTAPALVVESEVIERVEKYAASVEAWGLCVATAAREYSGDDFDPKEHCPEMPNAADHGFVNPAGNERGKSALAPGQTDDTTPGKSDQAPGQADDTTPGKSDQAPGQADDTTPGHSAAAPGHTDDTTPGKSDQAPGRQGKD